MAAGSKDTGDFLQEVEAYLTIEPRAAQAQNVTAFLFGHAARYFPAHFIASWQAATNPLVMQEEG